MNARQKAKKYKRDLEFYKKTLPKYEIANDNRKVHVFTVEDHYPMELASCLPPSQIIDNLVKELTDCKVFRDMLHMDNHYDAQTDSMIFKDELAVVIPDENSSNR